MRNPLKIFFSILIIFHLLVVVLIPNPQSLMVRKIGGLMAGYASTLGINSSWMFFSPSPAFGQYLEYEIRFSFPDDGTGIQSSTRTWPPLLADNRNHIAFQDESSAHLNQSLKLISRLNWGRLFYHSFLSSMSADHVKSYLIPWLCRLHPQAEGFDIRKMNQTVASIDRASFVGGNFRQLRELEEFSTSEFVCDRSDASIREKN